MNGIAVEMRTTADQSVLYTKLVSMDNLPERAKKCQL